MGMGAEDWQQQQLPLGACVHSVHDNVPGAVY